MMAAVTSLHLNFTLTQHSLFRPGLNLTSSKTIPLKTLKYNCCSVKVSNSLVRCCVNLLLKPTSPTGESLSTVIQNQPWLFNDMVTTELKCVGEDRDDVLARLKRSVGFTEASFHRRIAELKESECQVSVIDALYMIILYKFSETKVPLVPSLSKCLYNGRLEISPSKHWELESIHSPEILDMVREYLTVSLIHSDGIQILASQSTGPQKSSKTTS